MWALTSALTLALTTENRDRVRRWAVSLALALALHAGVVAAVLSWRYAVTSPPPSDAGPFAIDLAPAPSAPVAAQAEVQHPGAGGAVVQRSQPPEQSGGGGAPAAAPAGQNAAEKSPDSGEQKGEQKSVPAEAAPGVTAPAPLEHAGREDSEDKRSASGGGGGLAPAVPGGGTISGPLRGPIDTRITIVSPFGWRAKNRAARFGAPGQKSKGFVLVRPSKASGVGGPGRPANAGAPGIAINAIGEHVATGAHIQDRVRAALARSLGKNAVGGATPNNLGGAAARTGERTVVNAIGASVRFRPQLPATVSGAQAAGATPFMSNAGTAHANTLAAVNGTGVTHIGSGPGVVGGPARNLSGGINGTTFRLRRP